jgi:hypothetical protein
VATSLWLTDQASDIAGYRRAVLGGRGDAPSLVRAVTTTAAGPSSGIQATRSAGGTALAWVTDPLAGVVLTTGTWQARLWAKESDAAANAALRLQVWQWTTAEASDVLDDTGSTTELTTTIADYARTTVAATARTLADGNRLVFKVFVDDATGNLAAGHTVTTARASPAKSAAKAGTVVWTANPAATTESRNRRSARPVPRSPLTQIRPLPFWGR